MSKKQGIGIEEKVNVIQDYLAGKAGYTDSVKRGQSNETTFRWWIKQYQAEGAAAFLPHKRNCTEVSSSFIKTAGASYLPG